ncbi:DUF3093 domain-containing protein [Nocardioides ochotonae]|uniref:DUF3093 domain-containing protein n=1 Tax=Nocardioides ochotonae TaxID=2685869 RepID=UPI001CD78A56|nr:DUF3093 domain-containing protein [Nocardioides ochotonae]
MPHLSADVSPSTVAYSERLGVPLRWWAQGFMLTASVWLAVVVALPGELAWLITAVFGLLVAAGFLAYGSARITVANGELRAGRARISAEHLGAATALDPEQTRHTAGRDADARAFLLLRPYLKRSVRVEITDPRDPAPYWLLNTRRPDELARALATLTQAD